MEIRQLQSFVTYVNQEFMSFVSEELNTSVYSTQIQELERDIGYKLLNRDCSLTPAGEVFYQHALDILKYFQVLEEKTKDLEFDVLDIGYLEATTYWLAKVLQIFKESYPTIKLNLIEMETEEIKTALLNRNIHLGITNNENSTMELCFSEIFEDEYVVITPLQHPFNNKSTIQPAELAGEHFIYTTTCSHIKRIVEDRFQKANNQLELSYSTENLAASISLVEAGFGISIVPKKMLVGFPHKRIHSIHFNDELSKRKIALACLNDDRKSHTTHSIFTRIKQQIAVY